MLKMEHNIDYLKKLILKQLDSIFIINNYEIEEMLFPQIKKTLRRIELCFSKIKNKYFSKDKLPYFNFYHSDQYAMFLYLLSNSVFQEFGRCELADQIYYLNKIFNGIDVYYEVYLPEIFFFGHPVGSVLGRAKYSNYFCVSQNCTVGNNKGIYPEFEEFVTLFTGAKVLGNCKIGRNTLISANTYIKDQSVPANTLVFGSSPNLIFKPIDFSFHSSFWNV